MAASIASSGLLLANICAADPPPDPGLTALDIAEFLNAYDPVHSVPATKRVQDWFFHNFWWDFCQCVGTQVTPPPITPFPNSTVGTGTPTSQPTQACWDTTLSEPTLNQFIAANPIFGIVPANAVVNVTTAETGIPNAVIMPSGINNCSAAITANGTLGNSQGVFSINFYNSSGAFVGQSPSILADANHTPGTMIAIPIPTGAASWQPFYGTNQAVTFDSLTIELTFFCSGQSPTGVNSSCCPPDPTVQFYLNQILGLSTYISQHLASGALPPTYTKGAVHAGLTGTGTIPITGLFGMLVQVTTGIPTSPQLPGVPPYEWSVGWMSVLTPDGMLDEIRLTRQAQVWASGLFPFANEFGYQLNAGFTATFTELTQP